MVTIAVAIVLTAIAVPSFHNIVASSRLTGTANSLVDALNVARMEAIKRNAAVEFCSDDASKNGGGTLGQACGAQAGAVYVLTGAANALAAVQVHAATPIGNGDLELGDNGHITALRFNSQGIAHALGKTAPYTGTVADICAPGANAHRVITMTTGTIINTTKSHGACQ